MKYVLNRIFNMSFKNMFKQINVVHERSNKNRILIFFDMIICGFKYEAGYMDYMLFEMYNLNSKQRKTIMTRGKNNKLIKKYNDFKYKDYFLMKDKFDNKFKKYLKRDFLVINENNENDFNLFIKKHPIFFGKPLDGQCGKRIEKINANEYKGNLFKHLLDNKLFLIEEPIIQNEEINKLHPCSINTIRMVTIYNKEKKEGKVAACYFRIGNGKCVDNFNSGGMVVPVDRKTGTILYPAQDKAGNLYYNHPLTNTPIVGYKIPLFKEAIKLAEELSSVIPEIGVVGWDIAITPNEPVVVEGNEFPGHDIYQLPPHRTNGIGVLPDFEKILGHKL